jgi:hypothetical protein
MEQSQGDDSYNALIDRCRIIRICNRRIEMNTTIYFVWWTSGRCRNYLQILLLSQDMLLSPVLLSDTVGSNFVHFRCMKHFKLERQCLDYVLFGSFTAE